MEELFTVEGYRNYLINYHVYECDLDKERLEQRARIIKRDYSDEYLQTIIENTRRFSSILLEYMKEEKHAAKEVIVTVIKLNHTSIDIQNGCSGGFPSDALISPLLMDGALISEYLLKQSFPTFTIDTIHDSYEEQIDDIMATFPLDELQISCSVKDFDKIYESNSNKGSNKQLVK